jgi:hypothetical protein
VLEEVNESLKHHVPRGILFAIILGPIMVAGGALAAAALASAVLGWEPDFLTSRTALDFLYGGGSATLVKYFTFMVAGVVALGAWFAIRWAFTGRVPD